jgi:pimeloyl-ACP methyl ester carboxylesterase
MSVGVILIALLLLVGVFLAASVALSRASYEVGNARGDEYLELEGHWVRYRVSGGGPPVLLVHGWLGSQRVWEPLRSRLEGRFTVYSLDLAGFGESDKPLSGYGVRYGSRLLYAFCAHFGLTRAAVVGHDLGGAMALKLAADHPDVVGRLVLVATPADEDQIDLPTPLWLATLPVVGPVFYSLGRLIRPVRRLWVRPFVLDAKDLTEEAIEDAGRSTPTAVAKSLSVMRREISRGRLARQAGVIKTPVLVISGEEDEIVDPQGSGDWSRALGAEVVLLNDCGHLPQLERPRQFEAQVLAFLTGDASYLQLPPEEPSTTDEVLPDDETATRPIEGAQDGGPLVVPPKNAASTDVTPVERPRVFRKEGGGDAGGNEEDWREVPGNGAAEGVEGLRHAGNGVERRGSERRPGDGREADGGEAQRPESTERPDRTEAAGPLPELPRDLFDWPAAWKEFRPRDTAGRQGDPRRDEEHPQDPRPEGSPELPEGSDGADDGREAGHPPGP